MDSSDEIKIIYYIDEEETPYLLKVIAAGNRTVTLSDFKAALGSKRLADRRFFFKSIEDGIGEVKEEIFDGDACLPCFDGKIVGWLMQSSRGNAVVAGLESESGVASEHSIRSAPNVPFGSNGQQPDECGTRRRRPKPEQLQRSASALIGKTQPVVRNELNRYLSKAHQLQDSLDEYTETESTTGLMPFPEPHGAMMRSCHNRNDRGSPDNVSYDTSRMTSSEFEGTFDSGDGDGYLIDGRNRRRRRQVKGFGHRKHNVKMSTLSTCTGSTMSLNIITVTLNLDKVNFLGISIVGTAPNDPLSSAGSGSRSGKGGDVYVGSVMNGGAVALDGRIEAGDIILQVNDTSFENLTNEEAIKVLREAVRQPGPIKLMVAKNWNQNPSGYLSLDRQQLVHPIDPSAWAAQTAAVMQRESSSSSSNAHCSGLIRGSSTISSFGGPSCDDQHHHQRTITTGTKRTTDMNSNPYHICSGRSVSSSNSTVVSSDVGNNRRLGHFDPSSSDLNLTVNSDMDAISRAICAPDSGLDIRDRMWLKVRIADAFLGCDLVDWLHNRVDGFADRRDARKYASSMLKAGYIRSMVNKFSFTEQCYYAFGDVSSGDLSQLTLTDNCHTDCDCEDSVRREPPRLSQMTFMPQQQHRMLQYGPPPPPPAPPSALAAAAATGTNAILSVGGGRAAYRVQHTGSGSESQASDITVGRSSSSGGRGGGVASMSGVIPIAEHDNVYFPTTPTDLSNYSCRYGDSNDDDDDDTDVDAGSHCCGENDTLVDCLNDANHELAFNKDELVHSTAIHSPVKSNDQSRSYSRP